MYIGASVRIGETTRRYFEGLIDEVGIYDRALTDDEIERNYNAKGLAVSPKETRYHLGRDKGFKVRFKIPRSA